MSDKLFLAQSAGAGLQAIGTLAAGGNARAAYEFQAKQLEQQERQALAAASHNVANQSRETDLLLSSARAAAAKSGGGPAYDVLGDLAEEGEYRSLMALYEGQEAARGAGLQADAARFSGRQAMRDARFGTLATIGSMAPTLYEKYRSGGAGGAGAPAHRSPMRPMPRG